MNNKIENLKIKIQKLVNHYNANNYKFVIEQVKILLKKLPNNTYLYNLLGSCYQKLGDLINAKKIFLSILDFDKNNIAAMNNLGNTLRGLNDFNLAEEYFKKILKNDPNFIDALVNYGNLHFQLNKFEEAIKYFKKALILNNDNVLVHYNLGLTYQSLGQLDKARTHFNEISKINPNITIADKLISRVTKYKKDDPHLLEMIKKVNDTEFNDVSKINLYFALGKAFEDLKNYKDSFFYLKKGNDLKNEISKYDINEDKRLFEQIKKFFQNYNFNNKKSENFNEKQIIFILGLPRSGTSLVEQIIASHPEVYGAGELNYLENIIRKGFFNGYKLDPTALNDDTINQISKTYIDLVNGFKPTENIITDKAPHNFKWIGFIKIFFPNAKIIHCVRDPKDNCLSLYKNIFDENVDWTYNESSLYTYYENYYNLMNFWQTKLPDFILNISYEKLIAEPKKNMEKLINFCDLKWDDRCLEFYKTERQVKTVSFAQVRQPIYSSSVSSSKNYQPYLSELFSKLEKIG